MNVKDAKIVELETKLTTTSGPTAEMRDISDLIKCSEDLNSELSKISTCTQDTEETIQKLKSQLVEKSSEIESLKLDHEEMSARNAKLVSKKKKLGERYDELERYLTKIELKLEKKKAKVEKLIDENENVAGEVDSLKALNENILDQMNALKEESALLRESIAQKEAKLLILETKLGLSKEDLRMDINLNFNNLLKENHKLKVEVDRPKLINCISVKNHKSEMKRERRLHEELSQSLELMRAQVEAFKQSKEAETVNDISQSTIARAGDCVERKTFTRVEDTSLDVDEDVSTKHIDISTSKEDEESLPKSFESAASVGAALVENI